VEWWRGRSAGLTLCCSSLVYFLKPLSVVSSRTRLGGIAGLSSGGGRIPRSVFELQTSLWSCAAFLSLYSAGAGLAARSSVLKTSLGWL